MAYSVRRLSTIKEKHVSVSSRTKFVIGQCCIRVPYHYCLLMQDSGIYPTMRLLYRQVSYPSGLTCIQESF